MNIISDKNIKMCIYQIKNLINNKIYIGQTISIVNKRWRKHITQSSNPILKNSFKKYGLDNFEFSVLCVANSQEELNIKEREYITKLNSIYPNGYNLESGGHFNKKLNESSRLKMRNTKLGKKSSVETRIKQSISIKKSFTDERRIKISNLHKGKKQKESTIEKRRLKHLGFKFNTEQKINLARAHMCGKKIFCSNGKIYLSAYEASLDTGAIQSHIGSICNKKRKSSKGFTFSYIEGDISQHLT